MSKIFATHAANFGFDGTLRVLNVFDGDDITATLQAAIATCKAFTGGKIIIPPGSYDISDTILVESVTGIFIEGSGIKNTLLQWRGGVGIPAFKFDGTQLCGLAEFRFSVPVGFTVDTFLEVGQDNGTFASSKHTCRELEVLGGGRMGRGLWYRLYDPVNDLKNDFHSVYHCLIQLYTVAGVTIEGYNAKKLHFENTRVQGRKVGLVGVDTTTVPGAGGSFCWYDGQCSENAEYDWKFGKPNDPIFISGCFSQASTRFVFVDNDYSGIQPTEFWPITFSACKWSTQNALLPVDNIVMDIRGSGPICFVDGCKMGANSGFLEMKYRYLPQRITGYATDDLAITGAIADGETITFQQGATVITYTWRAVLAGGGLPFEVKIGGTTAASFDNLYEAINLIEEAEGVSYGVGTTQNTLVSADLTVSSRMEVRALSPGVAGNTIAVSTTMVNGAWDTPFLTGGSAGGFENVRGTLAMENSIFSGTNDPDDFFTELPPTSLKGSIHYNQLREITPMIYGDGPPFDADCFVPHRDPDWVNRGLPVPRVWQLMNRSTGFGEGRVLDMQEMYSVFDLFPFNLPQTQYEQVVAPFTGECVSFDNSLSQQLSLEDDNNDFNTQTTSIAMGVVGIFGTPAVNAHLLVVGGGSTGALQGPFVRQRTDGHLMILCDANTVIGTYNYDDGNPHVVVCILDFINQRLLVVTDKEIIDFVAAHGFPAGTQSISAKGIGSQAAINSGPQADIRSFFMWYDEDVQHLRADGTPGKWRPTDLIPKLIATADSDIAPSVNAQIFSYTVTGAEPDLTALVIALPAARLNTTYKVFSSQGQATNILGQAVLTASKTTTQFTLQLTGAATAGDIFNFQVVDGT